MRIAVTGATGKTGTAVVGALLDAGHAVVGLAHQDGRHGRLDELGAEVVVGDQTSVDDLRILLAGCEVAYHIAPNLSDEESVMAESLVSAARAEGLRRIVHHSVLHPQTTTMPHHLAKLAVEDRLLRAPFEVVFLQPAPYLQNLLSYVDAATAGDDVEFPYGPDTRTSMVHLSDVGRAAAAVAEGSEHVGAAYQLCGAERLTQGEAWAGLTSGLGLDVPYVHRAAEEWVVAHTDLDGRRRAWLAAMFDHYDRYGLVGSSVPLATLLGRPPRTLDDLVREIRARAS